MMQNINNLSFQDAFSIISNLEIEISKIENKSGNRLIALSDGTFRSVMKNEPGARNQLENSIERINQLLRASLRSLNQEGQPNAEQVLQLNEKITHINAWVNRSVDSYQARHSSFWRYIPILKWFTHNIDESKVQAFRTTVQEYNQILAPILAPIKEEQDKILVSRQLTEQLLSTVEPLGNELVSFMQEKSNLIREHITAMPKENVTHLKKVLTSVSDELKSIGQKMIQLKKTGQNLRIAFAENKITDQDFRVCQATLNIVIQEMTKVTESTLYFIQESLNDENTVFFTAWADQEAGRTDIETPLNYIVHTQLNFANQLLSDCKGFINTLEKQDIEEQNATVASIILSYERAYEVVKVSKRALETALNLLPEKNYQGRIETLTQERRQLQNSNNEFEQQISQGSLKSEELNNLQSRILRNNATIARKNELIKKFEDKQQSYDLALEEINRFEEILGLLTEELQQRLIIGLDNEPIGELTFTLANPIINGRYTVPAKEFTSLADTYSNIYIESLLSLQKKTREATVAFSELNRSIEESAFSPKYEQPQIIISPSS